MSEKMSSFTCGSCSQVSVMSVAGQGACAPSGFDALPDGEVADAPYELVEVHFVEGIERPVEIGESFRGASKALEHFCGWNADLIGAAHGGAAEQLAEGLGNSAAIRRSERDHRSVQMDAVSIDVLRDSPIVRSQDGRDAGKPEK